MGSETGSATRGHLVQFRRDGVAKLIADVDAGFDIWWINMDRNADRIGNQDPVFVWVDGPAQEAGIVALGEATGELEELDHPKSYNDPAGPRTLRPSAEVMWDWVDRKPFITRAEMDQMDLFADFELFLKPRQRNAFAVTPEQTAFLLDRFRRVMGG